MLINNIINHQEWSNRIRRRGVRRVAREAGLDAGYLSKIVNNKIVVSDKMIERLRVATNNLRPKFQKPTYGQNEVK